MLPQTAADYRVRAEECERLAANATSPETREMMIYLAHCWRTLAAAGEARKVLIEEMAHLARAQHNGDGG